MSNNREVLQRNEFLDGLEAILKKYGINEMYCFDSFDGTKVKGAFYIALAPHNHDAVQELTLYVDPTYLSTEDYGEMDPSVCAVDDDRSVVREDMLIYKDGVFYGR